MQYDMIMSIYHFLNEYDPNPVFLEN